MFGEKVLVHLAGRSYFPLFRALFSVRYCLLLLYHRYLIPFHLHEKSVFPFQSGTTNPTVKLFCIDLDMVVQGNVTLVEIEHPPELSATERILSAVDFPTDSLVYATWMNRVQSRAYFQLCDVDSLLPNCTTVGIISSFSRAEDSLSGSDGYLYLGDFAFSLPLSATLPVLFPAPDLRGS